MSFRSVSRLPSGRASVCIQPPPRGSGITGTLMLALALVLAACGGGGDEGRFAFSLRVGGLPDLGPLGGHYEGWAVFPSGPVSTGKFRIDDQVFPARVVSLSGVRTYGTVEDAVFGPSNTGLGSDFPLIVSAVGFFITVEPEGDRDGLPSGSVVLAGPIVDEDATLSFAGNAGGPTVPNPDYANAVGEVALANVTGGGQMSNGIWFGDVSAVTGIVTPNLPLPVTSAGWVYEGFVRERSTGQVYSTGRFRDPNREDFDAVTNPTQGPGFIQVPVPGQDFVTPAQVGGATALDLADGTWEVLVTVEPNPPLVQGPFPLPILRAGIPTDAVDPSGATARSIPLESPNPQLPELRITQSPGTLSVTGVGLPLPGFGVAPGVRYAFWSFDGNGNTLIGEIQIDAASQVFPFSNVTVAPIGTTSSFQLTDALNFFQIPPVGTVNGFFVTLTTPRAPAPREDDPKILFGGVDGITNAARLTVDGAVGRLAEVAGEFILASPTDDAPGVAANDFRGLWFQTFSGGPGLNLPPLSPSWTYAAYVISSGGGPAIPLGTFRMSAQPDDDASTWPGRGTASIGFSVPGQDFVQTVVPTTIPVLDLSTGFDVFVTLETEPDGSLAPSPWVILDGVLSNNPLSNGGPLFNRVLPTFPRGGLSFRDS